jgi:site-specific DNA recombinase
MLIVNPLEAEAVKLIFNMYLDGKTYRKIGDTLNERGLTTKAGQQFGNNSIYSILKNQKYTGTYIFSRMQAKNADGKRNSHACKEEDDIIRVDNAVPVLIDKHDFEKVQELMLQKKHKTAKYRAKRTYLLSGKVFCGECGMAYVGNCRVLRNGSYIYLSYRCNNKAKRPRCNGWEIRAETLESMVLSELANVVFNDALIPQLADEYKKYLTEQNTDSVTSKKALKSQIAAVQKDIDSLVSVIMKTSSPSLVGKLNELDDRKKELTEQLQRIEEQSEISEINESELLNSFRQAREMLKSGQLSTVKTLIERYVQKVIISSDILRH